MKIDTAHFRNLLHTSELGQEFGLAPAVCHELLNELERLRERLKSVLQIAATEVRPCRRCGQMLYFVRLLSVGPSRVFIPFTAEGIDHSTTHVKPRAATQQALIDTAPLPE